jgi:hypothetical protein
VTSINNNPTEQLAIVTQIKDRRKKRKQERDVPENTVIRFKLRVSTQDTPKKRTYVALYVDGRWWTTSTIRGGRPGQLMSNEQMLALLESKDVTRVEVASAWDEID